MGLSFTIAAGPRQRSNSQARVPRDSWPHITVSDARLPQLGRPDPRIYISIRNRVAQLYPRYWVPFSSPPTTRRATFHTERIENTAFNNNPIVVDVCIQIHCLEAGCVNSLFYCCVRVHFHGHVFIQPLPSNESLLWLHHSGFQASCHNIFCPCSWQYRKKSRRSNRTSISVWQTCTLVGCGLELCCVRISTGAPVILSVVYRGLPNSSFMNHPTTRRHTDWDTKTEAQWTANKYINSLFIENFSNFCFNLPLRFWAAIYLFA
jgi:hypothetical protein